MSVVSRSDLHLNAPSGKLLSHINVHLRMHLVIQMSRTPSSAPIRTRTEDVQQEDSIKETATIIQGIVKNVVHQMPQSHPTSMQLDSQSEALLLDAALPHRLHTLHALQSCTHAIEADSRCTSPTWRFPILYLSLQIRIGLISDKCPIFFDSICIIMIIGCICIEFLSCFDQRFSIFKIAIDCLNGCLNSVFL